MFSRIPHFLKGPNPLHPKVWEGRLSPMTFRRFQATDLSSCLELYALNEKNRFPEGYISQYRKSLDLQKSYYMVGERDGRIVASGGMSYWMHESMAILCFGLVHPDYQYRGVGTALLLARLALLNPSRPLYRVLIFSVERAIPFYRRFGFQPFTPWLDPNGNERPSGLLLLTAKEIRRCRALLEAHSISIPQDESQIPFRTTPDE